MAVDPLIARGVQPLDMTNALIGVAGLRQRDRALAQDQQALDFRQNALMQAQQQAEDDDAEWEQAYAAKDWGRMARLDPQTTRILWDREQASKPQRDVRQVGSALVEVPAEGDPRELYRAPQQAPQYAPTERERDWRLRQSLSPAEREEYDRLYGKGGGAGPAGAGGAGLNDRQTAGVNMQRANAIMYAANLTGMSREEIERILATEGPEGIERVMLEKGERPLQGAAARVLQSFPLGKTIVEAKNADLIAPAKGGGAGIALVQNPTGPVATADFQAGEAQFPNATYPLKTQAAMVRQMLVDSERMTGGQQSAQADPLAPYAGQVIRQGSKRFQVMQGRDGKYFAQEVK